jgi:hypothetical protein
MTTSAECVVYARVIVLVCAFMLVVSSALLGRVS